MSFPNRDALEKPPLKRAAVLILVAIFLALFRVSYILSLSTTYGYMGFTNVPLPLGTLALSSALALWPTFWLPLRMKGPSFVVLWAIYLMVYVPAMTVPYYCGITQRVAYLEFAIAVAIGFFVANILTQINPQPAFTMKNREVTLYWILGGLTGLTFISVFAFGNFGLDISKLDDVYGLRSEYMAKIATSQSWVTYLVSCQANLVNPTLLALGLTRPKRRVTFLVAGIVGQALLYMVTGFKSAPLSLLLILGFFCAIRKDGSRRFPLYTLTAFSALLILGVIERESFQTSFIMSLFQQRTLGMPGLLSGQYFEFYTRHPHAHLGYGLLKGIMGYPYGAEPPSILGVLVPACRIPGPMPTSGRTDSAISALPAFSEFRSYLEHCSDSWTRLAVAATQVLPCLIVAMPCISIANSSLLTSLLTQGVALSLVVIALLPPMPSGEPILERPPKT